MDSALLNLSPDAPWFVQVAADPLLQLLELHPHLNLSTLAHSQPANPFKIHSNQLERRDSCYTFGNNNGNTNTTASSGPSGALIGGIVAAVVVVIILAILAWFFWRRSHRAKQQANANSNPVQFPNTGGAPMPTPYDQGMNPNGPPMKQTEMGPGGYDMMNNLPPSHAGSGGMGPNYTSAIYPAPIPPPSSTGGWNSNSSNTGSGVGLMSPTSAPGSSPSSNNPQDGRQSYYNYAPPPSEPQTPFAGAGIYPQPSAGYYGNPNSNMGIGGTLGTGGTMYSGTPSPPPPSATPGATSTHSETTSYAPWAIPYSAASGSSSPPPQVHPQGAGLTFASAAEEKAHYSGYQPPPAPAQPPTQQQGEKPKKEGEGAAGPRMSVGTPAPPAYSAYTGPPGQQQ